MSALSAKNFGGRKINALDGKNFAGAGKDRIPCYLEVGAF